jgi:hypothetical protein
VQEGGQHIATMQDWGARTLAAVAACRSLGNETLNYECAQITRGLRVFFGHALRGFPGMDSGAGPFLHLDDRTFKEIFPDPATSTPTKRKAKG